MKLLCIPLLSLFLMACVGTNHSYAPTEIQDTKITFNVSRSSSDTVPPNTYTETGVLISYFDTEKFFSDATDFSYYYLGGKYTYTKNETNKFTINHTSIDGFPIITTLQFTAKNSGNFVQDIIFAEDYQIRQKGTFTLNDEKFKVLPTNINNRNFNLFIQQVDSSLPELAGLAPEQLITAAYEGGATNLTLPNGQVLTNTSYTLSEIGTYELLVTGKFQNSSLTNVLHLTFNSFMTGDFSLDLGDKKNVVSGKFNGGKFTSIDKSIPLKGSTIKQQTITSAITQITYPYSVYLPPGYENSTKSYPIIYVTDGQWNSDFSYILEEHKKEMIMVAIDQGPDNRRNIDFIPPGTTDYIKFIKTELIPQIETTYHHNGNRSFFGASLGGLLGAALIAEEPVGKPYFVNYLLVDGAFWGVTPELAAAEEAHTQLPIRLLLTHTRQGNGIWVNQYADRVKTRQYKDLFLINTPYNTLTHEQTGPIAFDDLIELIDDAPKP